MIAEGSTTEQERKDGIVHGADADHIIRSRLGVSSDTIGRKLSFAPLTTSMARRWPAGAERYVRCTPNCEDRLMVADAVPEAVPYASKIIKAGALLDDTRTLLTSWEPSTDPRENLNRIRTINLFGKASRARMGDILAIFRQRYLADPSVASALAILAQSNLQPRTLDVILYFYAAQSDRLLHDFVLEYLSDRYETGASEIAASDAVAYVRELVEAGLTTGSWSVVTTHRVAQGLLATLRDFGILAGAVHKRLQMPHLTSEAFAYIAFELQRRLRSGNAVVTSREWRLFFLGSSTVERLFVEAQQRRLLHYQAAGSIVRIDFPTDSLEEYARALAERPY